MLRRLGRAESNNCGERETAVGRLDTRSPRHGGGPNTRIAPQLPLVGRVGCRGVALDLVDVCLQLLLLDLLGPAHLPLDLRTHVRGADHDKSGLTSVQGLPQLLEVFAEAGAGPGTTAP